MAATSMAAAIAASLPAPTAQAAPAPPPLEIPASMQNVIDIEADIPVQSVQLDGMVVMKIIKHGRDAGNSPATGLLLGLDLDGILEVSNAFPVPHGKEDDSDKVSSTRYQGTMLRLLKEVQSDDTIVGFYQTIALASFYNQSLVELQAAHQERLRHGGVVIVHDTNQAARGNASFRAFKLSPTYLTALKKDKFSTSSLIKHELIFSRIFEEIPVTIRNSSLLNAFVTTLTTPHPQSSLSTPPAIIPPPHAVLELDGPSLVTRNLEAILDTLETQKSEDSNVSYAMRQIAREKAKADAFVAKRKEENAMRIAQGLTPMPEEDVSRLFRIPAEPSRLDGMLNLGQIDGQAKTLDVAATANLVKMYAARAGSA
ncbi:hypothetical protein BKA62DRAFT_692672 [Auriculariales sp. MPI-PUGE-AT-0066]|nr:hypothetical protein BKA62DRAFT_692672 [Auriculariales sp. MPI-PUGE-AT-0066]